MKRLVPPAVALLLALTPAGSPAPRAAEPDATIPPVVSKLRAESEVVDTGDVVRGQEARATFVLRNTGEKPVRILQAKPSCGCTVASFDSEIPPGGTGKVSASVRTEAFRGPIEKAVSVTTDEARAGAIPLKVKANVVVSLVALPRPGIALPTGTDWAYEGKLILRQDPSETGELHVTDVKSSAPWLRASARRVQAQEPAVEASPVALPGDWVLEVSVADDAPGTQSAESVTFKTGLPREPEIRIPVSVALQDTVRIFPTPLFLPPAAGSGKESSGTLSALLRPGMGGRTLAATASPAAFKVDLEPDGARRYKATVRWSGGDSAPRDGSIAFRIGDEQITVPVHVGDPGIKR